LWPTKRWNDACSLLTIARARCLVLLGYNQEEQQKVVATPTPGGNVHKRRVDACSSRRPPFVALVTPEWGIITQRRISYFSHQRGIFAKAAVSTAAKWCTRPMRVAHKPIYKLIIR